MPTPGFAKLIISVFKFCYCIETLNMRTFFCKNDKNDTKINYQMFTVF